MPTYKLTTESTKFVYGSPEQLHRFITDLPPCESLTELSQVNDLDLPQDVTPVSLGWQEILENGGESPEAWASMAKAQLARLGIDLEVTAVSEAEVEAYSGNQYERFLWVGTSPMKLLFPAVDLVIWLNNLTTSQVGAEGFWSSFSRMAVGREACQLTR